MHVSILPCTFGRLGRTRSTGQCTLLSLFPLAFLANSVACGRSAKHTDEMKVGVREGGGQLLTERVTEAREGGEWRGVALF